VIVLLNRTATRDRQFRLHVANQNDVSPRVRIGVPVDDLAPISTGSIHGSTRIAEHRMGAEKSGVGAVSIRRREAVVPFEGLGLGDA
jgi:hypothetical protein